MRLKMPWPSGPLTSMASLRLQAWAWPANVRNRQACTCRKISSTLKLSIRVTGEQLPDGEEGELVFTCIGKEALPLIRYRTRDISFHNP